MRVLISPINADEAVIAYECGTDIIDIKNTSEGSLGASFPWVIREVIERVGDPEVTFSATLGDLPFKPGTAALAARGAVTSGVTYIKAGLHGPKTVDEGVQLMTAVNRAAKEVDNDVLVVTAGYADYRRFDGLKPLQLVEIATEAKTDLVMMDTLFKDGKTLFDSCDLAELQEFVATAHENALEVALAGSIRLQHLDQLVSIGTDIVGVRGAVCGGLNRKATIDREKAREFMAVASA